MHLPALALDGHSIAIMCAPLCVHVQDVPDRLLQLPQLHRWHKVPGVPPTAAPLRPPSITHPSACTCNARSYMVA